MSIENKLTYLNETKNQIKSALNTPYNVFRDYPILISKYVKNQPKSIVEGSSAICENAVALPCNIDVNGNSYQETTEGYQVLDWGSNANFKNDTLSFSSTSNYAGTHYDILELLKNNAGKTLYFDCESYDLSKSNSGRFQIVYNNGSNIYVPLLVGSEKKDSFTIPSNVSNITSARLSLVVNNLNVSGTEYSASVVKPILSFTKTNKYEPYTNGASPNTEYEQDIEVVDGVNKLPYPYLETTKTLNGITFTDNGDGTITANGTATTNVSFFLFGTNVAQEEIPTGFLSGGFNSNAMVRVINNTDGKYTALSYSVGDEKQINLSTYKKGYVEIIVVKDTTLNNAVFKPMITETSGKPYLPYGHIGLKQRGKNIIPTDFDSWEVGEYDAGNGAKKENNARIRLKELLKVKPSETYYFNTNTNQKLRFVIRCYGKNKEFISSYGAMLDEQKLTTREDVYYLSFTIYDYNNLTSSLYETYKTMFETGELKPFICLYSEIDKSFEPYHEPKTIPINLNGNSIAKAGDIKDILNIGVDGSVRIDKKVNNFTWEGTEQIDGVADLGNDFYRGRISRINVLSNKKGSAYVSNTLNGLCTHFKYAQWYSQQVEHTYVANELAYIFLKGISNADEMKILLDTIKPTWYYPLAETEVIDLPSIEPIELFEGTNIFELVTNLGTTMAVEYIVDAESLTNEITELENAVIELGGTI